MADRAGFLAFIRSSMGITAAVLPDASSDIDNALNLALSIVYQPVQRFSPSIYDIMAYHLAGHNLVEMATDQQNITFFAELRKQFNINGFVPGVITSASDNGTSTGTQAPEFMLTLTMADLQYIKTPWGRSYMTYAQRAGVIWGVS